jgi:hypothetical protein
MSSYGFRAYDKSSEKEFTQANNQYLLRAIDYNQSPYVRDIDYRIDFANLPKEKRKTVFKLPKSLISEFKNKGWDFHFIPVPFDQNADLYYIPIIDLNSIFEKLKNWDGNDILFNVYYVPKNLTIYYQDILGAMRTRNLKCGCWILVGYK